MMRPQALCSLLSIVLASASPLQNPPFRNQSFSVQAIEGDGHRIGAFILDDVVSTCGSVNAANIVRAVNEYSLLTAAVQGVSGDDPSWVAYFGRGWEGRHGKKFFFVADNLSKAGQLSQPGSQPKVKLTCSDPTRHCGELTGAFTTATPDSNGVQTITFCPYAFDAGLKHLTDLAQLRPQSTVVGLRSFEYVLLHELMHLDNAGYLTGLQFDSVGLNHITDLRARLGSLDESTTTVYGPNACKSYASSKIPPVPALANADSYAWYATSKYFSKTWGLTVTKRDSDVADGILTGLDESDSESQIVFDRDSTGDDPDLTCAAQGQPATYDCADIQPADDGNFPDLVQNCYTSGNNVWCDLYTSGNCQASIGYAMGLGAPPLNNSVIASLFNSHVADEAQSTCNNVKVQQTANAGCPTHGAGGAICPISYVFCIKRLGMDCTL